MSGAEDQDDPLSAPVARAGSGGLDRLADTARCYAQASAADNTRRAYAADWAHFTRWCRLKGAAPLPPSPELIGLYLADLAASKGSTQPLSVGSIERRLSGLGWNFSQRGQPLDRRDRHIATVLAGIRRRHGRPPVQKAAVTAEDILSVAKDLLKEDALAIILVGKPESITADKTVTELPNVE